MREETGTVSVRRHWGLTIFGIVLALIGLVLLVRGVTLAMLGGSWYYVIAGVLLVLSGGLLAQRKSAGAWLFLLFAVGTVGWSLWEAGLAFWPLVPRLAPVLVLAFVLALLIPPLTGGRVRAGAYGLAAVLAIALVAGAAAMFKPHGVIQNERAVASAAAPQAEPSNWEFYGKTPRGTRFVNATEIDKDNVADLEVAWTYRTGEMNDKGAEYQNTPTQIGDTVYVCTPLSKVIALNAETGDERWAFDPETRGTQSWNRCRGVAYYEPDSVTHPVPTGSAAAMQTDGAHIHGDGGAQLSFPKPEEPAGVCEQRIVLTTVDARLIQVDAKTGEPCESFGDKGIVDLTVGMGEIKRDYYYPTSTPTVVRNLILIGGWVWDGKEVGEPSGVVRAFNADTGELAWAWDLGNPDVTGMPPEEGYARGTPNMWSTPAFDDELGLVYLPLGNGTPDFWGGHRTEAMNEYSSSIVAVDIATGRERWKFQTVHADTWDYDVGAQPALYDIPDGKGDTTPVVIQATKTGQLFVLDRRDGTPVAQVEERPVPQRHAEGNIIAATQPFSVGMPSFGGEPLTESDMWGATFFDQLECRIAFQRLNYEGPYTSIMPDETTLVYPGYYGGMNWGGVAVDEQRGLLIVNDIRMPQLARHVPQGSATREQIAAFALDAAVHDQVGVPYSTIRGGFYSPLGIPCHLPPWGTLSAVDLSTGELVWQRPAGTVEDTRLQGIRASLPIPVGMPTLGGPMATSGGLVFYAGTQDYYLRAFDSETGKELWKGRMPVGGQAAPMSYVSPESGRQFVVVVAGGARQSIDRGDYVIAYALPKN